MRQTLHHGREHEKYRASDELAAENIYKTSNFFEISSKFLRIRFCCCRLSSRFLFKRLRIFSAEKRRTCGRPLIFGVNVHSFISSRRTSSSPRRARCGILVGVLRGIRLGISGGGTRNGCGVRVEVCGSSVELCGEADPTHISSALPETWAVRKIGLGLGLGLGLIECILNIAATPRETCVDAARKGLTLKQGSRTAITYIYVYRGRLQHSST